VNNVTALVTIKQEDGGFQIYDKEGKLSEPKSIKTHMK
jgi:hypothetical protein